MVFSMMLNFRNLNCSIMFSTISLPRNLFYLKRIQQCLLWIELRLISSYKPDHVTKIGQSDQCFHNFNLESDFLGANGEDGSWLLVSCLIDLLNFGFERLWVWVLEMIFVKVSSKVFMIEFASSDWLDDNVENSSPFWDLHFLKQVIIVQLRGLMTHFVSSMPAKSLASLKISSAASS